MNARDSAGLNYPSRPADVTYVPARAIQGPMAAGVGPVGVDQDLADKKLHFRFHTRTSGFNVFFLLLVTLGRSLVVRRRS